MTMGSRILRVDGIPQDIPADRARDKLFIYFLRSRHGGGEVELINIFPGPPSYALVTFEESKVAQRVLQLKDHTMTLHGKHYCLRVSEVREKLEPDEVFPNSSVIVNYKQFPEKHKHFLKNLSKTNADITFNFDLKQKACLVSGAYTRVQAVIQEILDRLEIECEASKKDPPEIQSTAQSARYGSTMDVAMPEDIPHEPLYARGDPESFPSSSSEPMEFLNEPFVWDSEIYEYIRKFYHKEYQQILTRYNVQAVDINTEGITTLYLQVGNEGYNKSIDLMSARFDLLSLYQEMEMKLRKEQISRRDIRLDREMSKTMFRDLQMVCPMLLCRDDDQYLYFIGSAVDVAQAKQYINDIQGQPKPSKTLEPHTGVQDNVKIKKSRAGAIMEPKHHINRHAGSEAKVENKIAAKFSTPKFIASTQQTSPDKEQYMEQLANTGKCHQQEEYGRYPNQEQKVELTQSPPSDRYLVKNSGCEIPQASGTPVEKTLTFLKRQDLISTLGTEKMELRQHTAITRSVGPMKPLPLSKGSSDLQYTSLVDINPYATEYKMPEAKSQMRRSNSFSRINSRENSVSGQEASSKESPDSVITDTIYMDQLIWSYLKDIYKPTIEELCEGVILSEEQNLDVTILILKSTKRSKLFFAKEQLKSFYDKQRENLMLSSLNYEMLKLKGPGDKALEILCLLFQNCSQKLRTRVEKEKILLMYPKEVHSKVKFEYENFLEHKRRSTNVSSMSMSTDSPPFFRDLDNHDPKNEQEGNTQDLISNTYPPESTFTSSPDIGIQDVNSSHSRRLEEPNQSLRDDTTFSGMGSKSAKLYPNSMDNSHREDDTEKRNSDTRPEEVPLNTSDSHNELDVVENPNLGLLDEGKKVPGTSNKRSNFFNNPTSGESSPSDTSESQPRELQHFPIVEPFFEDPNPNRVTSLYPNRFELENRKAKDDLDAVVTRFSNNLHIHGDAFRSLPAAQDLKVKLTRKEDLGDSRTEIQFQNKGKSQQEHSSSLKTRSPAVGQEAEKTKQVCGQCKKDDLTIETPCGHYLCSNCISINVGKCPVCLDAQTEEDKTILKVNMIHTEMSLSIPGYDRDTSIKILYEIPDGVQGAGHPHPGDPYQGGKFEAFLPDNREGRKALALFKKALQKGLTFKVHSMGGKDFVTWNCIPHKTSPDGGKTKNGYPDSSYLKHLPQQLKEMGIE